MLGNLLTWMTISEVCRCHALHLFVKSLYMLVSTCEVSANEKDAWKKPPYHIRQTLLHAAAGTRQAVTMLAFAHHT